VEERAVGNRLGEVEGPPPVGEELDPRRGERAVVLEAHGEAREKRVPLARDGHVEVAVELHPHRAPRHLRREGHEAGPGRALRLLAAEAAAHSRALHHHGAARQIERVRHEGLHLGGVLRRGAHEERAVLAGAREGGLRLQVEVLLAADVEGALQPVTRPREGRVAVATTDAVRRVVKAVRREGRRDAEHRGQRRVLDLHRGRGGAGLGVAMRDHEADGLVVVRHHVGGEDGLVMADGAAVIDAWEVFAEEHRHDARHRAGAGGVASYDARVGVRGTHRPHLEHRLGLGGVVDVAGRTRDVAPGALVAHRTARIVEEPLRAARVVEREVLPEALGAVEKLLPQAGHQAATEVGPGAHVTERREGLAEHVRSLRRGVGLPAFAHEEGLHREGPRGRRRDTTVREACVPDDLVRVGVDHEGRGHDADVELAALRHLEAVGAATQTRFGRGAVGHGDGDHHLVGREGGLAVPEEEVAQREGARAPLRGELDGGVEGEQHRREVADGRGRHEVARHGGAVANLPRRKHPQHLVEQRQGAAEGLLHRGERRRAADAPAVGLARHGAQRGHPLGAHQEGEGLVLLVEVDAHLRRARRRARPRGARP
jgi:hypothetical protein